jgi:hypothetical protein
MEPAAEDARSSQMMVPAVEDGRCDGGDGRKEEATGRRGRNPAMVTVHIGELTGRLPGAAVVSADEQCKRKRGE